MWQGQMVPDYAPPSSCYLDTGSRCGAEEPGGSGGSSGGTRDPKSRRLLRTQLRNQEAERPFKCRLCPRSFTQSSHLNRHCLSHTGQQPFKCRFCGKTFARSDHCKKHEKAHTSATGRL